jgi:hypothetical protein
MLHSCDMANSMASPIDRREIPRCADSARNDDFLCRASGSGEIGSKTQRLRSFSDARRIASG